MRFGVTIFGTDETMSPPEVAREAEARGFTSIYLPEHTHIPISRRTPPATGDTELREEYKRTLDPFVALTAAAAVTTTIRLGTGVSLVAQRDPILTAKEAATLDLLSGGRFVFGIGFGWNHEEMESHGVAPERRRDIAREKTLAIKRLWADDVASFEGTYVHLEPSWSWPKPLQRPGPPILIGGGAGPTLFRHVAEYADGWIPIGGAGLSEAIPQLREAVAAAGRDPQKLEIVPFGSLPNPGKLEHFHSIGVTEVVFRLPASGRDLVLADLDRYAALIGS